MTITTNQISELLQFFLEQNTSNHILSLALTANDSLTVSHKPQTVSFERPSWDLLDAENSTISLLFNQYIDNSSSSVYYATNDTFSNHTKVSVKSRTTTEIPIWLIPCYSIILIFAIVGNLLVASTLFQNRRMRTITNVFLVNLAISDMLLGVLCMPITLVGTYLRHFIFGELVCKFIQFAQAASVAVSSWTLVAISCERYYAICHPLRSRTWQTINHAYKIIGCIWFGSIICMSPIAIFSQLIPTSRQGLRKCREQWPQEAVGYERFYNIFLDLALLVLPLAILCVAYILITRTLYMGIKEEKALIFGNKNNNSGNGNGATSDTKLYAQVETDMNTSTVYHLDMSFRYHTRKGAISAATECVNNGKTLHMIKTAKNNGKETCTDMENKYSAMSSISSSAAGSVCGRKGLCFNSSADTQAETNIALKDSKEQMMQQTQPPLQSKCNVDVPLTDSAESCKTEPQHANVITTTTATTTKPTITKPKSTAPTHELATYPLDGQRSQLYCVRSSSVKSLNRIFAGGQKQDADTTSCISLNAMSKSHFNRNQYRHQSFNQKQQHQQLSDFGKRQQITEFGQKRKFNSTASLRITESALRRSNLAKNLESKKRVVKMLFVLVLEFFICWTPLYIINTMAMFIGPAIYEYVDYTTISFLQLLAYSSSCCNPITYCFMNPSFRRAFVDTFRGMNFNHGTFWHTNSKTATNLSVAGNSIALANSCTVVTANTVLDSPRL